MNENKGIDNSRIKSYCAMALRLKMKKCVETIQITIANEYVTFGFSFRILVFFPFWESLNVTLFKRYRQCFSSLNPKRFRQTTLDWECWRLCRSFVNLTEWREGRVTCQQLVGDIEHTWKKTILIYWYIVTAFFQCRKSLYNTIDYMIKRSYSFSHSADSSNVDSNVSSAYQSSLGDIVDQSRDFLGSIALRWKIFQPLWRGLFWWPLAISVDPSSPKACFWHSATL